MLAKGGAASALIATTLTALGYIQSEVPDPVISRVNANDELLSFWPSEENDELPPDCNWFNGSLVYESELCSHFVLSRPSSSPAAAFDRARQCAAKFESECVLSPEIGLAIPAAFVIDSNDLKMLIGPRLFPLESRQRQIRVSDPGNTLHTRTHTFNETIDTEYLDGYARKLRRERLGPPDSFCVQLLRVAFTDSCWRGID